VGKSSWKRADDRRPLDGSGRADAKALAELLACFGPRARLITSPAARCVETLRPFAELSGVRLQEEPSLYIHNQSARTDRGDSSPSIAALIGEAIAAGEPTVFCAHRENIPVLQAAALAALGLNQPPSDAAPGSALAGSALANAAQTHAAQAPIPDLPKEWDDPLPTSGFWVLNLTRTPPPPLAPAAPAPASTVAPPSTAALAPAAPAPAAPASTAAPAPAARPPWGWRRWFRPRTRPPRVVTNPPQPLAAPVTAPETAAAPVAAPVATHDPEATPANSEVTDPGHPPAPRLISADRYDLTDP
jgi:hypothetical protein